MAAVLCFVSFLSLYQVYSLMLRIHGTTVSLADTDTTVRLQEAIHAKDIPVSSRGESLASRESQLEVSSADANMFPTRNTASTLSLFQQKQRENSSSSTSQHNAKLIDKSPPPQPPPNVKTSPPLDRTDEIAMQRARERRQAANAKYNSSVGVCIVGPLELFDFTAPWITGKPT